MRPYLLALSLTLLVPALGANEASWQNSVRIERNRGQAPAPFQFVVRNGRYIALLGRDRFKIRAGNGTFQTVRFSGASFRAQFQAADPLPGRTNYLLGPKASEWHTNIPAYGNVTLRSLYPGIDLKFGGARDGMEYDFLVEPGADLLKIALTFPGLRRWPVPLQADGSFVVGNLRHRQPIAYQIRKGAREAVECSYRISGGEVHFQLGRYDRSQPLTIDPLIGATAITGTGLSYPTAMTTDSNGNVYLTGNAGYDFPVTPGARLTDFGSIFVAKLSPNGNILFSTFFGGNGFDRATAIASDSQGNCFLTGDTTSPDFPVSNSAFQKQLKNPYSPDAFVAKLSAAGDAILYSTYLGGSGSDIGNAIAVDAQGRAYVTGTSYPGRAGGTPLQDFPTTPLALMRFTPSGQGAFIARLSADGRTLEYASFVGEASDNPIAMGLDAAANMYVSGSQLRGSRPVQPISASTAPTRCGAEIAGHRGAPLIASKRPE